MKKMLCLILSLFLLSGCTKASKKCEKTFFAFDTIVTITIYDEDDAFLDECEKLALKYENMFSKTISQSDIFILNRDKKANVSPDTRYLLEKAVYYSNFTGGAFDVTVGALSEIWKGKVPEKDEIENLLKGVGADKIGFDDAIEISEKTKIDLGGIAKGYIADEIAKLFYENGKSGIINLGGNVCAVGKKGKESFNIGIQKPFCEGEYAFVCRAENEAIVTSGIYERYFKEDGKIYHHIIDPKTGFPCDNNFYSVTVIDKSSLFADVMATALLIMGDDALPFAEKHNIRAAFIHKDYSVTKTKHFD